MKIEINLITGFSENYKDLIPLQGKLKEYEDLEGKERLKKSILSEGIIIPTFVWENSDTKYIWDGHGRADIYKELEAEGYEIPEIPVVYLVAKNLTDAKLKLIKKEQDYRRKVTKEGFVDFLDGESICIEDMDGLNLPGLGELDISFLEEIMGEKKEYVVSRESDSEDDETTESYEGKNKEIDTDNFGSELEHTCPKCGFEFND